MFMGEMFRTRNVFVQAVYRRRFSGDGVASTAAYPSNPGARPVTEIRRPGHLAFRRRAP
jgi:hypothetical protein